MLTMLKLITRLIYSNSNNLPHFIDLEPINIFFFQHGPLNIGARIFYIVSADLTNDHWVFRS